MKKIIHYILLFVSFSMILIIATQCAKKTRTVEDTIKDYYSSIEKNNYKSTNPDMIAGWAAKTDNDKLYLEEFQGTIADIFKQHKGLKEVKIVSNTPSSATEAILKVDLVCNDGYTESVTQQMVKEGEVWKIIQ
jgi:hypothetical protein